MIIRKSDKREIVMEPSAAKMLPWNCESDELLAMTFSDTVFGFLDSGHGSRDCSGGSTCNEGHIDSREADEKEEADDDCSARSIEENKAFWDNQHKVLKETLCKSSSMERAIRNAVTEARKEAQNEGKFCVCRPTPGEAGGGCQSCLMNEISRRLRQAGYDSAVCKSKWRSSPEILSGEHMFIDVLDNSNPKKSQVRVIIELNFKAEFEMERASEEYKQLVARLPDAFIGKSERLQALVKILCISAKKCMKDKKLHMGPWRKYKYMLAKWFSTCQRMEDRLPIENNASSNQLTSKPKASLLTVALRHDMHNMQPKAVAVL